MLARVGNYVQWKSRIKRYIDTKPNSELIHYCLQNPPYTYQWAEKTVSVAEGSSETTTKRYMENYKNVSQDIRDQLNAEAEAVQIILTGIDNDIYSTVDACPNASCQKSVSCYKSSSECPVLTSTTIHICKEPAKVTEDEEMSKEKEIDKLMALISLSFKKFYKPTNNNLQTSSNTSRANQDNSPRINRGTGYDNQRAVNVAGARENVVELKSNYIYMAQLQEVTPDPVDNSGPIFDDIYWGDFPSSGRFLDLLWEHPLNGRFVIREMRYIRAMIPRGKAIVNSSAPIYDQEPATVTEDDEMSKEKEIDKLMALISLSFKKIYKPTNNNLQTSSNTVELIKIILQESTEELDYHKEKMLLCKQEEAGVQLNAEQADWKDDTDDEFDDQELEAHYMYMAQIQEVTPDAAENSGPIIDAEPFHKVQNNKDNYNVFAIENAHLEQPESVNDIYLEEQGDTDITIDSLDMCYDREQDDQDDTDELNQERDLLASLIDKLKYEIDDSKNHNEFLESSHKDLVDKLKGELEDFKTKNKSLESSNNHFKEANNELSKTNQLMFKDLKKFQSELDKYHDVNYASKVELIMRKLKGI
ncbi:hypothetical protein Tco_0751800 [Tanacetum coccineum]|uniref:Uncharacterized protein n=1 Tax=Tanacetum coccineum TaxID=301880 RepID=A0ABQ4Z515_9ASTR